MLYCAIMLNFHFNLQLIKNLRPMHQRATGRRFFSSQMIFFVGEFFILSPSQLSSVCKSLNRIS